MARNEELLKRSPSPHLRDPPDCIVIGGGFAGITCAHILMRHRRHVHVFAQGPTRNATAGAVHGMLGSEGIDPEQLLASAWTEALKLGLSFTNRRVDRVERTKDVFIVSAGDSVLAARCVVFAYGVVDQIPSVPGAAELYGRGVFHCPTCDAFEVMHQTLAAYGPASKAATLALELLTWAKWVLVFSNGTAAEMDHRLRTRLDSAGVKVIDERVRRLIAERDRLAAIELETGKRVNVGALFFTLDTKRGATLAENLGCAIDEETDTVKVDEQRETTVRGAYAVGDIVAGPHLVVKAAADGAIAAIAIHKSLEGA